MRRQAGLISNLVESRFCHVLGHTLGHGLVRPVHETVKARAEDPTPREKKSLAEYPTAREKKSLAYGEILQACLSQIV